MKKNILFTLAAAGLLLVSCGGNSSSPTASSVTPSTSSVAPTTSSTTPAGDSSTTSPTGSSSQATIGTITVELDGVTDNKVFIGTDNGVTAIAKIDGVESENVTWSSSNTAVATVDSSGFVVGVAEGTADIIATSKVDTTKTGKVTITVEPKPEPVIEYTAILDIQKIVPETNEKQTVTYTTVVNVKGLCVAKYQYGCILYDGAGYMLINDTKKGASKAVVGKYYRATGKPECYVSKATDKRWWVMTENKHDEYAFAEIAAPETPITPETARTDLDQAFIDDYANNEVRGKAVFFEGNLAAVKNGKYTNLYFDAANHTHDVSIADKLWTVEGGNTYHVVGYLMENSDGHVKLYVVSLEPLASELDIDGPSYVVIGETGQYSVSVLPEGAKVGTVTWSVTPANVASIDQNGLLTGLEAGVATIEATADGFTTTLDVDILAEAIHATAVAFDKDSETVGVGGTVTVAATVTPEGAIEKPVYSSSDDTVATVDPATGLVTGVKVGTAVITATVGEFTDTITINVADSVTKEFDFLKYHQDNPSVPFGKDGSPTREIVIDDLITLTVTATDPNSGKIYVSTNKDTHEEEYAEWRMYKTGNAVISVSIASGYKLLTVSGYIGTANWTAPDKRTKEAFTIDSSTGVASKSAADANFNVSGFEFIYAAL